MRRVGVSTYYHTTHRKYIGTAQKTTKLLLGGEHMKWECNPYFTPLEKINLLQRWLIVHSIIYYKLDTNVVSDAMFDKNSRQLVAYMNKYPLALKKSKYVYCMSDFDGSTGFDLPGKLNRDDNAHLFGVADYLARRYGT